MLALASLAALALAVSPQELALLPDVPEGWQLERLEFPLSFAPELAPKGFEELAFAPGMFDPKSDSYWSYALAIRIEEDIEVDEAWLEHFFAGYYRGLCEAVGAGREPALDLSQFSIGVDGEGERFTAAIELVDAFVTGAPLTLALAIDVQRGARSTELFGIASPLGAESRVWKELENLRLRWLAAQPMPVFLNHVYVAPDAETYAAILAERFLGSDFAVWETRRTQRRDMSYSGTYFYGHSTYFEFLAPGDLASETGSGIALGIERRGGSAIVARALGAAADSTTTVTRTLHGVELPWFDMQSIAGGESGFALFTMEYDERFVGIARRDVIACYVDSFERDEPAEPPLFNDLTDVYVRLSAAEAATIAGRLETLGWIVERPADDAWRCDGPGVLIHLRAGPAEDERARVTCFDLALREPVERAPLQLGRATLEFEGSTARFRLEP